MEHAATCERAKNQGKLADPTNARFSGAGRNVIADQHLHLERGPYSPDNYPVSWLEQYLEKAKEAGVQRLGVVEHAYRFVEARGLLPGAWSAERCLYRIDPYVAFAERVKARHLPVSFGLEMDFISGQEESIGRFLSIYPWDFVLGSVHFVDGVGVDLELDRPNAVSMGHERLWRRYFELSREAVRSGLFDVLSHPDLPKIFGQRAPDFAQAEYELTAKALAEADMAIECNTAGLRKPVGEIYPVPAYLAAAQAAGVPVSLGSDAHEPENVGRNFADAIALLRSVQYGSAVHFVGRCRISSPL